MSGRKRSKPQKKAKQPKPGAPPKFLLDIVMPVFGEWGMLARAISQVAAAAEGIEYRIIVVDNGSPPWQSSDPVKEGDEPVTVSPEEQAQPVKELLRPVDRFLRIEDNIGYPGACNFGVSKVNSPLVMILTSDVYMEPGSINVLVREMDNPQIGLAGPLLLFPPDDSPHGPAGGVQSAGIAFDIQGDPFHVFLGWSPDNPRVKIRRDMQAVTGAMFITRRSLWEQIGGFASVYGQGTYEDVEYCFEVRSRGYTVVFQPAAVGYHYVGGSIQHGAGPGGFPLTMNAQTFKGRWGRQLQWDAFRFL
jgi:GT2 family glycosyltransferase